MSALTNISDDALISLVNVNIEKELRNRGYEYGWYKKEGLLFLPEKEKQSVVGMIYVIVGSLHNTSVKIGFTKDISEEIRTLDDSSGMNEKHHCYAIFKLYSTALDSDIASLFSSFLSSSNANSLYHDNWFNLSKDKAYSILLSIACIFNQSNNLVLNPLNDSYFKFLSSNPSNSIIHVGARIKHRDFGCGVVIAVGSDKEGATYNVRFDDGSVHTLNSLTFNDGYAWKI